MEDYFKEEKIKDERLEKFKDEDDIIGKNIQERIKILMKEKGLTQIKFFEYIDYNQKSSNASKILNQPQKLCKNIVLLKRISKKFNVSINWLIGNLSLEIRNDSMKDINTQIGLSEDNILKIHNILESYKSECEIREKFNLPIYESYKDTINKFVSSNYFISILDGLRKIEVNNRNNLNEDFGYSLTPDEKILLSPKMAKEFLIQDTQNSLRILIEDKYK